MVSVFFKGEVFKLEGLNVAKVGGGPQKNFLCPLYTNSPVCSYVYSKSASLHCTHV